MHTCPHCMSATISSFDKWISDPTTPATCSACGGLSYVDRKSDAIAKLGAIAIGVVGTWAAARFMNFYPLLASCLAAIAWFLSIWRSAPMVRTDISKVADVMTHWVVAFYVSLAAGMVWFVFLA